MAYVCDMQTVLITFESDFTTDGAVYRHRRYFSNLGNSSVVREIITWFFTEQIVDIC